MVKVVDYDSFGAILSDSNPGFFLPLAFAGGLRDRFTGLVRFCHRDYDPTVGRFTAQDPLGDTGGDHDPYDYCVDEPVGRVDPEGLEGEAAVASGGFLDGLKNMFGKMGDKIGGLFSSNEAQAATGSHTADASQIGGAKEAAGNATASPQSNGASSQSNEVNQSVAPSDSASNSAPDGNATTTPPYWTYDHGASQLTVHNSTGNSTWSAVSGTSKLKPLPEGNYTLSGSVVTLPNNKENASYCDTQGNCWWQKLDPDQPNGRTGIGIHWDGGKPGTAGCIGATGPDSPSLQKALEQTSGAKVQVKNVRRR